ncbi:MAG: carboxypeptidase regulatory-like domain-containing protein [Bacteroidia bacterium]|nr:carboxypeptidase regulatory-like domain-containing protein [Bacteroidia bacterium]
MIRMLQKSVATLMLVLAAVTVWGQGVTSANFFGQVTDANDQPLVAATVIATHVPSGTRYGTTTREDGRFNLSNVRIGGPYTLAVSYVGYKSQEQSGIVLSLGQNLRINFTLQESSVSVDEVVISAERNEILNSERTGAATNVSKEVINTMPTLNRSISDFVRLTPQSRSSSVASTAGAGSSFAGQDSRFNNLTIDGSIFNNSFGLASAPAGQTNSTPISLDAIEEIQVNVAPFDVRQGGFTGAGVNAVTRSGSNQVQGSVFYNLRNNNFVGKSAEGTDVVTNDFDVAQYGFRLGGPIMKDKLFFFVNGEFERRNDPATSFVAARPGLSGANVARVAASTMDSLRNFLIEKYNYDPGEYENYLLETYSDKLLVKLDYNLSATTKVSLRYNYLRSFRDVLTSNSGSFQNRNNNGFAMNFQNSNYVINNDIHSVIAEINTVIGNNAFNSVTFGFTANRDYRSSRGGIFPLVDILEGGRNYTTFGYEPFTPNNRLNTDTWQFQDNFTLYKGQHTLTGGVNFEAFKFENTFTPTYYGQFVYNSLADFYADANGADSIQLRRYSLTYSALEGSALPTATTQAFQPGAYVQDVITTNKLSLTLGLRADLPLFQQTALENETVSGLTFKDAEGNDVQYSTSKLPDPHVLISPRVGFNYDVLGDRSLQVRGGSGLFSGRPAFVWISNQVGNNGILTGSQTIDNTFNYPFNPDVTAYIPSNATTPSSYNIAVTDPNFRFMQVWRTNIAVDKKLPGNLVATVEGIFTKNVNNVNYINANLEPSTAAYAGADTRPYFPALGLSGSAANNANRINDFITDAIVLQNTSKGYTYSLTAKLERQFTKGLYLMAAYNFSEAKDLITAGSIAFSSWRDNRTVNGNNLPDLAFSDFDQRHRIIGAATYRLTYGEFGASQLSLFLQSSNQGRYSYFVNGDVNGDQQVSNDLLYVPSTGSEINFEEYKVTLNGVETTYTADQQRTAFMTFVDNDPYLSTRKGQYAERNGALLPWLSTIDLSFQQEFAVKVGSSRNAIQLRADAFNFGNLLSDKWGVGDRIINNSPLQFRSKNADNQPVYRFNVVNGTFPTEALGTSATLGDVWQMQFSVRYIFN